MKNRTEPDRGGGRSVRRPDTVFWVDPSAVGPDRLALDADESRHLLHVHRASKGAPFTAVDGAGCAYECILDATAGSLVEGRIVERHRDRGELAVPIRLIAGLGDTESVEAVVELAVPLGVGAIDLASCLRSGRPPLTPSRLDRLARVARAAMKQSRRSRAPEVRSSTSLAAAVALAASGVRVFADPDGRPLHPTSSRSGEGAITIAVGPPGGFDADERSLLLGQEFVPISLGPSRLRTELAAATLLAVVRNSLF